MQVNNRPASIMMYYFKQNSSFLALSHSSLLYDLLTSSTDVDRAASIGGFVGGVAGEAGVVVGVDALGFATGVPTGSHWPDGSILRRAY